MTIFQQQLLLGVALAVFSRLAVGDDVEDAERVCTVINSMGSTITCAVNASERAVDLTGTESVDDPAEFCTTFSAMVAMATTTMSASWNMRLFMPESSETPAAVCRLN